MAYDPNKDYSEEIKELMSKGASAQDVGTALQERVSKATNTPGLEQFAYDDVYKNALSYIANIPSKTQAESTVSAPDMTSQINQYYDSYRQKQLDDLMKDRNQIQPYYETVKAEATGKSAQDKMAFNEYANAYGLNAGAGGQAELARQGVLMNQIGKANREQANAFLANDLQRSQVENTINMERARAIQEEIARQQKFSQDQRQFDAQLALQRGQLDRLNQNDQFNRLYSNAQTMAQFGDFSGYRALGFTEEQIASMTQGYKDAMAQQNYLNSLKYSGGGTPATPTAITKDPVFITAQAMSEKGYDTATIEYLANNSPDEATFMNYIYALGLFSSYQDYINRLNGIPTGTGSSEQTDIMRGFRQYG